MSDKIFVDGLVIEPKDVEKIPWLKASLYARVDDLIKFLEKHKNDRGFVNMDVKEAKNGRWYVELNTFKASRLEKPESLKREIDPDSIPF